MKKIIKFSALIFIVCLMCVGCGKQNDSQTTTSATQGVSEESVTVYDEFDVLEETNETTTQTATTEAPLNSETTTKKNQSNPLISDEDLEKIENSKAEAYFTDNPDNKYIKIIANKYGVKKENLVALIKINAEFPSAMVFEFSGKKDANGELIMTYNEFKNFYNIDEKTNQIIKASKNGFDNDGISYAEAQVYLFIAREYIIPELPNLKANKRYPD